MAAAVGVALIAAGALLIRYRAGVADWQIRSRVEELERSSLMNEEYVDRERASLQTADQRRLSRLLVAVFGLALIGVGVAGIVSVVA